jgi:copper(I)-binding protein
MRYLLKSAFAAVLIVAALPAFADDAKIAIEDPYARATPAGAQTGAVYMTIDNKTSTPDRLAGAASDVAAQVQVHEMSMDNGVMKMRELTDGLAVPAGGSVTLKPGSYHVMLIGLKKPLAAGDSFPLTLKFEKAGNISVTVPVKAMSSTQGGMGNMGGMGNVSGAPDSKSGGMGHMDMK